MHIKKYGKYGWFLVTAFLLSGCVSLKLPSQKTQFNKVSAHPSADATRITRWNMNGAFSVQQNNKANIANYSWEQNANHYKIRIQSALNIYSLLIQGSPSQVTLWESKQQPLTAKSPEILMQRRLGWHLPVSFLRYWILGLPAPQPITASNHDSYGHLTELRQQGWQVTFSNYTTVKQYDVPRMLQISGHGLKIKVLIKNWSLP